MYQRPPPFELPAPSRQQRNETELGLSSPSQGVFVNQNPYQTQMSQPPASPWNPQSLTIPPTQGPSMYQQSYHPSQILYPHPMPAALPRPENMTTPSRNVGPAPRTPDPAAMQHGAFAGMGFHSSVPETPSRVGRSSTALLQMNNAGRDYGFGPKVTKLFSMAERYCYSHMNFPSAAKDSQLPLSIKDRLMKAATRDSAHQIGSTGSTRYFLMTKVILQWIVKHVCKQSLFTSFDLEADRRITSYRDNIYQGT